MDKQQLEDFLQGKVSLRPDQSAEVVKNISTQIAESIQWYTQALAALSHAPTPGPVQKSLRAKCGHCLKEESKEEKMMKCGRCKQQVYCSGEHQKLHWKIHKTHCVTQEAQAAAAAAVTPTNSSLSLSKADPDTLRSLYTSLLTVLHGCKMHAGKIPR